METDDAALKKIALSADYKKYLSDALLAVGKEHKLSGLERPKDFHVSVEEFSVDNDLMTPTFKLKRHKAKEYFKPQIDKMYEKIH